MTEETKSEETTETKLKRIAQRSKEDRRSEFKWLMQHVNVESLRSCYRELEGNKAVGIDGQTKEEYGKNLEENIPDLVQKCITIMSHYPDQKGIIHGTSYALCKKLNDRIRSPRILFPESASQQKMILEQHALSSNTVLLSPSMTEGVDLKEDASRFQIIVKVPFPYLGDPIIKKRMELYPNYYGLQTILTIVQAYGRSVRSAEDWAHTYVLDGQFHRVVQEQRRWLPEWVLEAIQ